jgi:hypothetical protein
MRFEDSRDYIIACMLPSLQIKHDNVVDATREFTSDEAKRLYMDGLPLLMNHMDGEMNPHTGEREPLARVGTVMASSVAGGNCMVLGEIDPSMSLEATFSSNAVAKNIYGSVSLGNTIETHVRASSGSTYLVKTPDEVSLCKVGRRGGSTIRAYCPGRETIRRLHTYEPDVLDRLIDDQDWRSAVIASGASRDGDGERYITAVAAASRQRLETEVRRNRFQQKDYSNMSVAPIDDQTAVATEAMKASDAQVDELMKAASVDVPSVDKPLIGTAVGERSVATQVNEDQKSVDAKAAIADAIKARQEALEIKKAMAALQAKHDHDTKELHTIKAAKTAKQNETFETAVKSVIQNMVAAEQTQKEITEQIDDLSDVFQRDPERGLRAAERAVALVSKAAANMQTIRESEAKRVADQTKSVTDKYIADGARQLQALRQEDAAVSLQLSSSTSAQPTTPGIFDRQSIESAVVEAKTAFERRFVKQEPEEVAVPATEVGTKRSAETIDKVYSPVKRFAIKASEDKYESYDAVGVFANQCRSLGRVPWLEEVEMGAQLMKTGRMKASANGLQVEEEVIKATRSKPAYLYAGNFNPSFDKKCNQAMTDARFRVRGGAANFLSQQKRMTVSYGSTVELHD